MITRAQLEDAMDAAIEQLPFDDAAAVRAAGYTALVDALYRALVRLEARPTLPAPATKPSWAVELVPVKYVGGPLDGIEEELTPKQAVLRLEVGGNAGYYGPTIGGKRYWHRGAPA